MILPEYLREKMDQLSLEVNGKVLKSERESMTNKYKTKSGMGRSLISSEKEGITYALCRMPATFAVLYSLISSLNLEGNLKDFDSVIDIGSGTGSAYFALKEIFPNVKLELFERDKNMIQIFETLAEGQNVNLLDITLSKPNQMAELVMSSYVLSELDENAREIAFKNMLEVSKKYVLIIDTGTPKVYADYLKLKPVAERAGFRVVAPCMCKVCPLENDYCQFYARVERSAVLKNAKSASQSYEDEKYFYLLFEKIDNTSCLSEQSGARVIRRPVFKPSMIELVLCSPEGVKKQVFTKKNKEAYKKAKKAKINERIF